MVCNSGLKGSFLTTQSRWRSPTRRSRSIASRTTGYEKSEGFIPVYLDPRQGKLLLELPRDSTRALLVTTQATGLGSNPIGIDRGSDGATDVVRFDRDGERVSGRGATGGVVRNNGTTSSSA